LGRYTLSIGIDRVIVVTPRRLTKAFNIIIEYITISIVLSIPVCVIVLIVCSSIDVHSHSMHTVVDFVNDAS
jgi:hypothetical protein